MKRYGRGWYGDSYRHYLAGKGVSTVRFVRNKYYADDDKKGFMDKHKLTVESNNSDAETDTRQAFIGRAQGEVQELIMRKVDAGELDSLSTGPYWDRFNRYSQFMSRDGDAEQYKDEIDGLKSEIEGRSKSLEIIPSKI